MATWGQAATQIPQSRQAPQEEHWEFPFTVEQVVGCGRYAWTESLFFEMFHHPLTDQALAGFDEIWEKVRR